MLRQLLQLRNLALSALLATAGSGLMAQEGQQPDFPPADKVLEGYEKVVTKASKPGKSRRG